VGHNYLCIEVMLVYPSASADGELQRVNLILRSTVAWAPHTLTASVCGGNTGSIGASERTGGRTEGGKEVLLVIEGGADPMNEVVADVLCTERASSRLIYARQ
jgi:hypothetical protein